MGCGSSTKNIPGVLEPGWKVHEKLQIHNRTIAPEDQPKMKQSLIHMSHTVWSNFTPEELQQFLPKFFHATVKKGAYIIRQKQPATCFFVIDKGHVTIEVDNIKRKD